MTRKALRPRLAGVALIGIVTLMAPCSHVRLARAWTPDELYEESDFVGVVEPIANDAADEKLTLELTRGQLVLSGVRGLVDCDCGWVASCRRITACCSLRGATKLRRQVRSQTEFDAPSEEWDTQKRIPLNADTRSRGT